MGPWSSFRKDNRGAVAPIAIIMLVVFLALVAIVIDLGHLMMVRGQLQDAADAGALAGARALYYNNTTGTPNWANGQTAALAAVQANKADTYQLQTANVQTGYWDTTWTASTAPATLLSTGIAPGPTDTPAVKVQVPKISGSNNGPVALTFGRIFGLSTVNVTAHAVGIVVPTSASSPFANTVFSNLALALAGTQNITGSVQSNNNLNVNGVANISGAATGVTGVNLTGSGQIGSVAASSESLINNGGSFNIGSTSGGASTVSLASYNYTSQIQSNAGQTVNGNYTQSGSLNLTGNMYVSGTATLNGDITGSGMMCSGGNMTVTSGATTSGSSQIFLYSSNGNITISGATNFGTGTSTVIAYAPNGTVTITGTSGINGIIIGNQVNLPGGSFTVNGGFPITTLAQFEPPALVQ